MPFRNIHPLIHLQSSEFSTMNATIRPPHILLLLVLFLSAQMTCAQDATAHLRRKCFLGIQPLPVPDSLAKASGLTGGILLNKVVPGGTFALMGAQAQDVLIRINGMTVENWETMRSKGPRFFEGDALQVDVWRSNGKKGKVLSLAGKAVGAAREQSSDRYDIQYGEAPFQNGYLRTITMLPKTAGPHPVIYFIPGYSCFSIDNMNRQDPYPRLFDSLVALGNIVYRVEKPGLGDGPSPCDCRTSGFEVELNAFEAGYQQLLTQPWAQEDRIFIVGHSMGGIQAPLLMGKGNYHPKGIAVYGTVFQTWYEYMLMMLRFQNPRAGQTDYITMEEDMHEYIQLLYEHYVLDRPLATIIANPKWKALLERDFQLDAAGNLLYRTAEYWQEISHHTLADAWAKTDAHVLSIFGEVDFEVFDAFSMSEIARIVNAHHPGHGSFVTLPGTDHGMIHVGPLEKALELRGQPAYNDYYVNNFDYRIVTELQSWIARVMKLG